MPHLSKSFAHPVVLVCVMLALSAWFFNLATAPISLISADLGRHIMNGKLVLSHPELLEKNFYSYVASDFPFVNHHWGSGLIFSLWERAFGFTGLSILQLLLGIGAFLLIFAAVVKKNSLLVASAAVLWGIPLIASRQEVRPETLSLFFCALFYFLLSQWRDSRKVRWLWPLPLVMVVWVNSHIYFIFGLLLFGAFLLEALLNFRASKERNTQELKPLLIAGIAITAALFCNPLGPRLLLVPLQIFQNYGYRIKENQSVYFLWNFGLREPVFWPLFLLAPFSVFGIAAAFAVRNRAIIMPTLLFSIFLITGFFLFRNVSFTGLFCGVFFPALALAWKNNSFLLKHPRLKFSATGIFLLGAITANGLYFFALPARANSELGLAQGVEGSARFFRENNIRGPIFNNYDIGSYLIYELFPQERVFVDNRPEAYPPNFFAQLYIPMQEDESVWRIQSERYGFNVIYFYWHDLTTWAQAFLIRRVKDPAWVPVYVDDYALIFVKNTAANQAFISKFAIPREKFQATPQ